MHLLHGIFTIITICGCSRTSSWSSSTKRFLYNIYTIVLLLVVHTFVISQLLDIVFNGDDQENFNNNFYITLPTFVSCFKMFNMLTSRENYATLIDTLHEEPLLPMNTDEIEIRTRFDKLAEHLEHCQRWNTILYTMVVQSCLIWMFSATILTNFKNRTLTYRAWLPFDYSSYLLFSISYAHQTVGILFCALLNIACDSLCSGLLIHTNCQFEILRHRLQRIIKNERDSAKQCARLHNHIYKLVSQFHCKLKIYITDVYMDDLIYNIWSFLEFCSLNPPLKWWPHILRYTLYTQIGLSKATMYIVT
ncbi:uncharacterized protein LOC143153026 [Ptiloglossa arizonensis]|uniref:uncharacterized protein LOC143153026 n=1 Tax=Ptiloglossa arizonensis TaxID=3350558 RepID=UPI003FA0DB59